MIAVRLPMHFCSAATRMVVTPARMQYTTRCSCGSLYFAGGTGGLSQSIAELGLTL